MNSQLQAVALTRREENMAGLRKKGIEPFLGNMEDPTAVTKAATDGPYAI